ncbi:MAG: hypothetical protein ACRDSP_21155 [Pseudonocardiaceae bacterium]
MNLETGGQVPDLLHEYSPGLASPPLIGTPSPMYCVFTRSA